MSKRLVCALLIALLGVGLAVMSYSTAEAGNGAPSGPHYTLNIIGVKDEHEKNVNLDGGNGHRIFVDLGKTEDSSSTKILLLETPDDQIDFAVIDPNGTDGTATFQLPNPDPNNDGITRYRAYARGLGKWQGNPKAIITPAFTENGQDFVSMEFVTVNRPKGQSRFENVTRALLYVFVDVDGNGTIDRIPLFSRDGAEYFWTYDNFGLKLAQIRFYEIPDDINNPND